MPLFSQKKLRNLNGRRTHLLRRVFPVLLNQVNYISEIAKVAELADAPDLGFRMPNKQFYRQTL